MKVIAEFKPVPRESIAVNMKWAVFWDGVLIAMFTTLDNAMAFVDTYNNADSRRHLSWQELI